MDGSRLSSLGVAKMDRAGGDLFPVPGRRRLCWVFTRPCWWSCDVFRSRSRPLPVRVTIRRVGASKNSDNAAGVLLDYGRRLLGFSRRLRPALRMLIDGGSMGELIILLLLSCVGFFALSWPYHLGTWLAVQSGADNPSTARSITGWGLEVVWLALLLTVLTVAWLDESRERERVWRLELEKQQRLVDFGEEGARLYEQAAASVAWIAGSEAARAGWLGDPSDFDFRADLTAMADNLRRAEEIREASEEGASIMHLTAADKKMLEDARRAIAALENAATERSRLIEECARQAGLIDTQFADDRERGVMAKRREDLRNRLGPVLYSTHNIPAETPSESADVVKARAAAFHELRGVLRNYRLDGDGV